MLLASPEMFPHMPLTKIECDHATCPPDRKSVKLALGVYPSADKKAAKAA